MLIINNVKKKNCNTERSIEFLDLIIVIILTVFQKIVFVALKVYSFRSNT